MFNNVFKLLNTPIFLKITPILWFLVTLFCFLLGCFLGYKVILNFFSSGRLRINVTVSEEKYKETK